MEHARAALSEEKYRSLMEHANDAVMILDAAGTLLEANPCAERLFGRSRAQLLGASFDTLVAPTPGLARSTARRLIEGGGAHPDAFEIPQSDGPARWVEISASTVSTDDAPLTLAIARDVTERRRVLAEIQALNGDLDRRVKERTLELEASNHELEAFSYSVAHDLRARCARSSATARSCRRNGPRASIPRRSVTWSRSGTRRGGCRSSSATCSTSRG